MTPLITKLIQHVRESDKPTDFPSSLRPTVSPPATVEEVEAAEVILGFQLPSLLRQIYLEVGNGGFGPGYGLYGVPTSASNHRRQAEWADYYRRIKLPRDHPDWWPAGLTPLVFFDICELYLSFSKPKSPTKDWKWPLLHVPICSLGCDDYICIDCRSDEGPISYVQAHLIDDEDLWEESFRLTALSLQTWLEDWLQGGNIVDDPFIRKCL